MWVSADLLLYSIVEHHTRRRPLHVIAIGAQNRAFVEANGTGTVSPDVSAVPGRSLRHEEGLGGAPTVPKEAHTVSQRTPDRLFVAPRPRDLGVHWLIISLYL